MLSQQGRGQKQNTSAQWLCYSWMLGVFFFPLLSSEKHTGSWIMHFSQNSQPKNMPGEMLEQLLQSDLRVNRENIPVFLCELKRAAEPGERLKAY